MKKNQRNEDETGEENLRNQRNIYYCGSFGCYQCRAEQKNRANMKRMIEHYQSFDRTTF